MAATLSLTNCTEEFQTGPDSVKTSYTIYADAADTKTANDGFSTKWSKGDSLNVFHVESGSAWMSNNIPFGIADVETGEFTSDSFDGNLAEVNDWYVIYPYNNKIISPSELDEVGYLAMGARVGSSQVQKGNDSMAHIGGKSYPMYGIAKGVAGSEFPHIMMTHLTSLIEVVVTNSSDTPITVNSVTFDAPENITGTYYVGIDGEEPSFLSSGDAYVSDVVRLAVKDAEPIETGASAKFYFAIKPFTAPAGETLTLTVNNVVKTFELDKDVVFSSGKVKTLNFNIDEYYALDPGPYTSNMVWTLGEKAYTEKGIINDVEDVKVLKIGTGSVYSSASVMVPAGTSKIGFYAVSWNGNAATLALKKGEEVIGEVYPPVNEGASNTSPYTIYENDEACYFEITVNAEEDAEYSFVPSGKPRVIIWGVNYYTAEGDLGEDQAPVEQEVVDATIPEFLAAEVSSDVLYRVSGTIASIEEISEKYNNATLTIEDADANALYIFRMKPSGEENIADLGLNVGDELTVVGCRGDYEGNPQMVNGYYESHIDGEEPDVQEGYTVCYDFTSEDAITELGVTIPEAGTGSDLTDMSLTIDEITLTTTDGSTATRIWNSKGSLDLRIYKGATMTIAASEGYAISKIVVDGSAISGISATDYEKGVWTGFNKRVILSVAADAGTQKIRTITVTYTEGEGVDPEPEPEPEPEPDDPVEVVVATVADFLAAAEDDTVYELTGVINNVTNTNYGNFDLVDDSGSVYIYGLVNEDGGKVFTDLGLKAGDTITVRGTRGSYEGKPEMINALYVSHEAGEEPEPEPDPDRITIDNGDYWIIADGNVATPLAEDKTYGYLGVVDAVDNASTAANAFTFTHSGDGLYTIQDSFGRYVYQTGTYNSFNVSAELGEDNGYYWTLSMSDEAYVIMNYGVSKFIQYDASYNSYGSYPDARAVLPTLVLADNPVESEPVEPEDPEDPEVGETTSYTLTFADKSYRTEYTTETQVWSQNGVILTNEKASSTSNVGDYANPLRMYQGSSVAVSMEDGSLISKIEFTCNAAKYVTPLQNSINTATTADGNIVTVVFETPVDVYSIEALTAQVRLNSLTVYTD